MNTIRTLTLISLLALGQFSTAFTSPVMKGTTISPFDLGVGFYRGYTMIEKRECGHSVVYLQDVIKSTGCWFIINALLGRWQNKVEEEEIVDTCMYLYATVAGIVARNFYDTCEKSKIISKCTECEYESN